MERSQVVLTPLDRPWYYRDAAGQLNCCQIRPYAQEDPEAPFQSLAQIDCFRGSDDGSPLSADPLGIVVRIDDGYAPAYEFYSQYEPLAGRPNWPTRLQSDPDHAQFYLIERQEWDGPAGAHSVRAVSSETDLIRPSDRRKAEEHDRTFAELRRLFPESRLFVGFQSDLVLPGHRDGAETFGPIIGLAAFPGQKFLGVQASYQGGLAVDSGLADGGASWHQADLLVALRVYGDKEPYEEKDDFRIELLTGHSVETTAGDWRTIPRLRRASFMEAGPLNVWSLLVSGRLTDLLGLSAGIGTGPTRLDYHTEQGVVEGDIWDVRASVALTIDPLALADSMSSPEVRVIYPSCPSEPLKPTLPSIPVPLQYQQQPARTDQPEALPEVKRPRVPRTGSLPLSYRFGDVSTQQDCKCATYPVVDGPTFKKGSADLDEPGKAYLDRIVSNIQARIEGLSEDGYIITRIEASGSIGGYTDSEGDAQSNVSLGDSRAKAVEQYLKGRLSDWLTQKGVTHVDWLNNIVTKSHGEGELLTKTDYDGHTSEADDACRRADGAIEMRLHWEEKI